MYTNPVYPHYFADPFVLKHNGMYYAYGTGAGSGGMEFAVLTSPDLVQWTAAGYALKPSTGVQFWAPEVAYHEGRFYMYYSAARGVYDQDHALRIAISTTPTGPFNDIGIELVPDQPFTIDAHPFRASDGTWYLYYAQDFTTLDDDHRVGTGIVVDRLINMTKLAGDPKLVVRPHADWHLFKAERPMYNAVYDWYTVEGPAVLEHNGKFYCFYSGGAWERDNYAVSYVVADHPLGPYTRPTTPDGAPVRVLSSLPGQVIGPGHNSFTTSPNGDETMIVYHAWDTGATGRRMCIDRLVWDGDTPRVIGPTYTPQPDPR